VAGCCEYSNEHLGFIKCGGFLNWLRKCQLLNFDPALLSYSLFALARIAQSV
jgi:hypothetical protein